MPGDTPRVTLALPTWNGAAHLHEALESCLVQPRAGVQLLLVDDGSVDDTLQIARRFEAQGLEIHRNAVPLGLAGNWNRCLALARGEYVGLLHQDDRLRAGWLQRAVALLDRHPSAGLVHAPHLIIDAQGRPAQEGAGWEEEPDAGALDRLVPGADVLARLFSGRATAFVCPGVLARRSVWEELGGFDPRWRFALDLDMWLRVSEKHDIGRLGEVLVEYRRHDDQQTSREPSPYRAREMIAVKRAALERADAHGRLDAAARAGVRAALADECVRFARRHAGAVPRQALEHLRAATDLHPPALRSVAALKGRLRARLALAARPVAPPRAPDAAERCPVCGADGAECVAPAGSTQALDAVVACRACGLLRTTGGARAVPGALRRALGALAGAPADGRTPPPPSDEEQRWAAQAPAGARLLRHELQRQGDPLALLRAEAGRLAPGGALLVVVPDATLYSAGRDLDAARRLHFTPASLRATLARAGLEVADVRRLGLRGTARALGAVARRPAQGAAGRGSEAEPGGLDAAAAAERATAAARVSLLRER